MFSLAVCTLGLKFPNGLPSEKSRVRSNTAATMRPSITRQCWVVLMSRSIVAIGFAFTRPLYWDVACDRCAFLCLEQQWAGAGNPFKSKLT